MVSWAEASSGAAIAEMRPAAAAIWRAREIKVVSIELNEEDAQKALERRARTQGPLTNSAEIVPQRAVPQAK